MPALLERIAAAAPRRKDFAASSIGLSGNWSKPPIWSLPDLGMSMPDPARETITDHSFDGYVQWALKASGPVFACYVARLLPFSEGRLAYRELVEDRPGRFIAGTGLDLVRQPWPNGTTGDLFARMEAMCTVAGNFYATPVKGGKQLRVLRPDWVTIITGSVEDPEMDAYDLNAEVLGYIYHPKVWNPRKRRPDPVLITPDRMVHYAPIPDPQAQWRGMSWLTPVVREINSDTLATQHKEQFFRRGAQLSVVLKYDKAIKPDDYKRYVELFEAQHAGVRNAYKALHLGGGADATVIGADMKQVDFRAVQGAGETRIAAAAGVGAIIAQLSEGLQGSALNAGNYGSAKRRFADMTLRPMWRQAATALQKFTTPPQDAELAVDTRDVEFLKEDRKDAADILGRKALTIRTLTDAGFLPDAVVDAVEADDLSRLAGKHSGRFSVQLFPPENEPEGAPA